MAKVSVGQLELLLNFIEQHHLLKFGRVRGKEGSMLSKKLWSQCSELLNSDIRGAQKSAIEWKRYFNQYKSRTKAKYQVMRTGGETAEGMMLTPLEERLIQIFTKNKSPLPVKHDPLDNLSFDPVPGGSNDHSSDGGDVDHDDELFSVMQTDSHETSHDHHYAIPMSSAEFKVIVKDDITPDKNMAVLLGEAPPINVKNMAVLIEKASPSKINVESKRAAQVDRKQKRPRRENNERQRPRRHHSSSSSVDREFKRAELRLAAIEQSCVDVTRKLTQAVNRSAAAMEKIAEAISSMAEDVSQLVRFNITQQARGHRYSRSRSSSRTSSSN